MSTYSINANIDGLTLQQRDSLVSTIQGLGLNKMESLTMRELPNKNGVFH
jgi:hypothetical protein